MQVTGIGRMRGIFVPDADHCADRPGRSTASLSIWLFLLSGSMHAICPNDVADDPLRHRAERGNCRSGRRDKPYHIARFCGFSANFKPL